MRRTQLEGRGGGAGVLARNRSMGDEATREKSENQDE